MVKQFLLPLNRQFDSGFGSAAWGFHNAANALDTKEHRNGFGLNQNCLPILYLYRHSVELYLKAVLTLLHRRFRASFPKFNHEDFPQIMVGGKDRPIFSTHSLWALYESLRRVLTDNKDELRKVTKSDWIDSMQGLEKLVHIVEAADAASTMFRYPVTLDPLNDAEKSSYKPITLLDAVAEMQVPKNDGQTGAKILALQNEEGEVSEMFIYDDSAMDDVRSALVELAKNLSGIHFGIMHELLHES